jgi:hypothetical protein
MSTILDIQELIALAKEEHVPEPIGKQPQRLNEGKGQ